MTTIEINGHRITLNNIDPLYILMLLGDKVDKSIVSDIAKPNFTIVVRPSGKSKFLAKDGDYTFFAAVATDNQNAGFVMSVDGKDITDTILAAKTDVEGSFDDYAKVQRNVTLTAGKHILRFTVTGDWMDIDYINFVKGKDAEDTEPMAIAGKVKLATATTTNFDVFDLSGKKIARFTARNMEEASRLWRDGSVKGSEKARGVSLIRNCENGMISKVRVTR